MHNVDILSFCVLYPFCRFLHIQILHKYMQSTIFYIYNKLKKNW